MPRDWPQRQKDDIWSAKNPLKLLKMNAPEFSEFHTDHKDVLIVCVFSLRFTDNGRAEFAFVICNDFEFCFCDVLQL